MTSPHAVVKTLGPNPAQISTPAQWQSSSRVWLYSGEYTVTTLWNCVPTTAIMSSKGFGAGSSSELCLFALWLHCRQTRCYVELERVEGRSQLTPRKYDAPLTFRAIRESCFVIQRRLSETMMPNPEFDPTSPVRVRPVFLRHELSDPTIDQVRLASDERECSRIICRFAFRVFHQGCSSPAGDIAIIGFNSCRIFCTVLN